VYGHSSDINKNPSSPSIISDYRMKFNHNFDWEKVKILDTESSFNNRLISGMVYIKRQA